MFTDRVDSSQTGMPTGTKKITQNIVVALEGVYLAGVCRIGEDLPYLTGQLPFSQLLAIAIMWECDSGVA